ncbi:MAG: ATP-binding protein [Bacteroidales bacterium]
MDRKALLEVIYDQKNMRWSSDYLSRAASLNLTTGNQIEVISGIRRSGKSTVLNEIRFMNEEKDYYMNFDDDRLLHFKVDDFQLLYELFIELFGEQKTFYFDEIQNIEGWERFVRRLHDYGNKIYITGSNARLLSYELGTHLTGRYTANELFPFSFHEYLKTNKITVSEDIIFTTAGKATLKKHFFEYMANGGFPEYLKNKSTEYLKSLYESILYRDVLVRNKLVSENEMRELVFFLSSNLARPVTFNSLSKSIGVKNASTVKNYLQFLENSYLIFQIGKFDYSVRKQMFNPKKVYFIDNALVSRMGFHFSEDKGRFLENMVFLELKRRGFEVFYHKGQKECDFILREGKKITSAIQVSVSLNDTKTREREITGVREAMDAYQLTAGLILTEDGEETITTNNGTVDVLPVWKWLLT